MPKAVPGYIIEAPVKRAIAASRQVPEARLDVDSVDCTLGISTL